MAVVSLTMRVSSPPQPISRSATALAYLASTLPYRSLHRPLRTARRSSWSVCPRCIEVSCSLTALSIRSPPLPLGGLRFQGRANRHGACADPRYRLGGRAVDVADLLPMPGADLTLVDHRESRWLGDRGV